MDAKPSSLATWVVGIFVVVILAALLLPGFMSSQRASNERGASATLKTLTSAEADFRGNDRDKNGVQDFWTRDVAGLFNLVPTGDTEPIRLIGRETAEADPSRLGPKPWAGYWFQALDQDEDGLDYRQGPGKDRHPSKFAFCSCPVDRGTGRAVFYVNEGNTIFKMPFEGPPRRRWFSDDELKLHFSRMLD